MRGIRAGATLVVGAEQSWAMGTSPGPKTFNADRCWVWPNDGLYVVADGAGSGPAGDAASIAGRVFCEAMLEWMRSQASVDARQAAGQLGRAVACAHHEVVQYSEMIDRFAATTLVAAVVVEGGVVCCSVGDSSAAILDSSGRVVETTPFRDPQESLSLIGTDDCAPIALPRWDVGADMLLVLCSDGVPELGSLGLCSGSVQLDAIRGAVEDSGSLTRDNATLVAAQIGTTGPHDTNSIGPDIDSTDRLDERVQIAQAVLQPLLSGRLDLIFDPVAVVGRVASSGAHARSLDDVKVLLGCPVERSIEGVIEVAAATANHSRDASCR